MPLMPEVSLFSLSATASGRRSLIPLLVSADILWRTSSIHLWSTSSIAPPSGRDFTAMLRTSSR